jgi:hypothetical protein
MTRVVVDLSEIPGGAFDGEEAALLAGPDDPDATDVDPEVLASVLEAADDDAVTAEQEYAHPEWARGDPCPNCGNTIISEMELQEYRYVSEDDHYDEPQRGQAEGPSISIICGECTTELREMPFRMLEV